VPAARDVNAANRIHVAGSELVSWRYSAAALGAAALIGCGSVHAQTTVDVALRQAAQQGDLPGVKQILKRGADPNQADALVAAIENRQRRVVDYLLDHGANPNAWVRGRSRLPIGAEGSPVFQAANLGEPEILRDLKRRGANLDAESMVAGTVGETPLVIAARQGKIDAARLLLDFGADVNHRNPQGKTPLQEAIFAEASARGLVQLLLDHGADPDIRDPQGISSRDTAFQIGGDQINAAIEKAKPGLPFERPGDADRIRKMLLYKSVCDASIAGYATRTGAVYAQWQAPRAAVIARIVAQPGFQKQRADVVKSIAQAADVPQDTQQLKAASAELGALCEAQLPVEFRDARRR
jgi:hypothetical protein